MQKIIETMRRVCPVSDATVRKLAERLVACSFPKRHRLIRENVYSRCAYFIERGMTRSFWPVDGNEITTSF